jgi:hypothetical protein
MLFSGTYTCYIKDNNGCISTITIVVDAIQGIEENNNSGLQVNLLYPNPNNGQFSFQVAVDENVAFDYQLMDQQGRSVLKNSGSGNNLIEVNIEQPATGMYHLQIVSGDKTSSFKINVIQ